MSSTPPQVVSWPHFDRELKRLKRKYPHIEEDVRKAIASPSTRVDAVPGYSHRLWKVRIPSSDMRRRVQGGFRLYLWMEANTPPQANTMYPVTIYPKSKRADLSVEQLRAVLNRFFDWAEQLKSDSSR